MLQKKICLLGDYSVGKTSLVRRYVEGRFDDRYLATIGVKISRKVILRPIEPMNLLIWDMTGGEDLGTQTRISYLRGSAGALMVCDLTRRETLVTIERYAQQMRVLNPQTTLLLIGNKQDLVSKRVISDIEMQGMCSLFNFGAFYLTSAKTGENVETAFNYLADLIEQQE